MECGCSSGVEHNLAKVRVVGSNPIARSNLLLRKRRHDEKVGHQCPAFRFTDYGKRQSACRGWLDLFEELQHTHCLVGQEMIAILDKTDPGLRCCAPQPVPGVRRIEQNVVPAHDRQDRHGQAGQLAFDWLSICRGDLHHTRLDRCAYCLHQRGDEGKFFGQMPRCEAENQFAHFALLPHGPSSRGSALSRKFFCRPMPAGLISASTRTAWGRLLA